MSLPVKKIYVDSRYMTNDSVSTSSFKFQLARNLFMPQNTVYYLEDVCIPHAWHTVEQNFNDTMYVYTQDTTAPSNQRLWILKIPQQLHRRHFSDHDTDAIKNNRFDLHSNLRHQQLLHNNQHRHNNHYIHHTLR